MYKDYDEFIKYRETLKPNCVALPQEMHIEFFIEIIDWCTKNFGYSNFEFDENCLWFVNKQDALMFKMRWQCE